MKTGSVDAALDVRTERRCQSEIWRAASWSLISAREGVRPSASQTPEPAEVGLRVQRATGCGVADAGFQSSPVAGGRTWDLETGFGTNGARAGLAEVVLDASSFDQSGVEELVRRYVATVLMGRFQRLFGSSLGFWCQSVPETVGSGESAMRFGTVVRTGVAVVVRDAECLAHRRLARRGRWVLSGAFQSPFAGGVLGCQSEPEAFGRAVEVSFFFGTKVERSGRAAVVRDASSFDQSGAEELVRRYVATVLIGRCQRPTFLTGDFGFQRAPETVGSGASEGMNTAFVLSGTASVVLDACPLAHRGAPAGFGVLVTAAGAVHSCGGRFAALFGVQRPPETFGRAWSADARIAADGGRGGALAVVREAWPLVHRGFLISFAFLSSRICASVFVLELLSHRYVDFGAGFHSCGFAGSATRFFHMPSENRGRVAVEWSFFDRRDSTGRPANIGAAVLSFCHSWGFSGASTAGASSVVPQSPVPGRPTTASLAGLFHSPSGGAEKALAVNSRRLRRDSSDRPAKMGAVAPGFSPHRCVVGTGAGVAAMALTVHNPDRSFLRHRVAGALCTGDVHRGPSIETGIGGLCGFRAVRRDNVGASASSIRPEPFGQSFVFASTASSLSVGAVLLEDQRPAPPVPDIGRHSSRGREGDFEAAHNPAGGRAKRSGGALTSRFPDRSDGTGTGTAGPAGIVSHFACVFCHSCAGLGGTRARARSGGGGGGGGRHKPCCAGCPPPLRDESGAHRGPVAGCDRASRGGRRGADRDVGERCAEIGLRALPDLAQSGKFFFFFCRPSCGACVQVRRSGQSLPCSPGGAIYAIPGAAALGCQSQPDRSDRGSCGRVQSAPGAAASSSAPTAQLFLTTLLLLPLLLSPTVISNVRFVLLVIPPPGAHHRPLPADAPPPAVPSGHSQLSAPGAVHSAGSTLHDAAFQSAFDSTVSASAIIRVRAVGATLAIVISNSGAEGHRLPMAFPAPRGHNPVALTTGVHRAFASFWALQSRVDARGANAVSARKLRVSWRPKPAAMAGSGDAEGQSFVGVAV